MQQPAGVDSCTGLCPGPPESFPPSLLHNQRGECLGPPTTQITHAQDARDLLVPQLLGDTRRACIISLFVSGSTFLEADTLLCQGPRAWSSFKHSIRVTCSTGASAKLLARLSQSIQVKTRTDDVLLMLHEN